MPGNPRDMIISAERRFPVRIRIGVPPGGFGQGYAQITAWLDENCGADGWAMFVRQDVTQERDWETAVNAAEKLGGLHGLVNNAGIYRPRTLMETDTELFELHMRINQLGCFLGMKAVVQLMEQSGGGSIVNISSVAGLRGSPGAIAYSATKWALRGMTKAAAIDLAPRKIRVNSVHPGPIDTEMLKVRTPEQNRQRLKLVPMKRMGTAEEVAALVLFLLSDESGYVTGAEVAIDGGATL
jgi:3alpha(or 20beta)-hydroxysteroid dehydrogenase